MLQDSFKRRFSYLRLSLTESCNFRCNYCLPDGSACDNKAAELTLAEIKQLVQGFAHAGTTKVRLTGGEPTLRRDLCSIIETVRAIQTIKLFGAEPANFLDVGGGATPEKVTEAFKIMLKNPKVKAILVNIFGGIMKCDTIATGVITACKATNLNVPLVVRMKGTNEELGKKMLAESGLPIISADTMAEAAEKVVAATRAAA